MKRVKGYKGRYFVTKDGRVWSAPREWEVGMGKIRKHDGKWLRQQLDKSGYFTVKLCSEGNVRLNFVHRLVADAFLPKKKNKYHVNHIDGIKTNNHVSNLEWCTPRENAQHAAKLGLLNTARGEASGSSKLSDSDVAKVRSLHSQGIKQKEIASMFDVCPTTISRVVTRSTWNHLH